MERYICIHGHFYQPPRENAWLEDVEMQDSAYPYHDWNEKIAAECYAPNTASRILDSDGYISQIVNNYAKISFNFGPTLLAWMEEKEPDVYQSILETDRETQRTFSGHGSALAQAYHHIIMPLANRRDKYTQVIWGMRDFEHRFGRKAEGMWLPETAVDLETLDILAEQGIKFTILAPHQANQVRQIGTDTWQPASDATIDPTMAYEVKLPSGRKLALFFYNGPISRGVSFEDLLNGGENFAHRLFDSFSEADDRPQLVHIATDGETYGHHHRFGDMALAYTLHYIETNSLAQITNYGEYLEKHPPTHEVEIKEKTSWSCSHGIDRWWSNCGCNAGRNPKWNQAWRTPLRNALDWLRDYLVTKYEELGRQFFRDPWASRDDYIEVVLDRSPENTRRFLDQHCTRELSESEVVTVLKLLELQRHSMLMYTSCGWFFDELSGIETVQVIQYAGRAVQLAGELFGEDIEQNFLGRLEQAKSNLKVHGDGRRIYEKFVKTTMIDLDKVTAHFAISSVFERYGEQAKIYCYNVDIEDYQTAECGRAKLAAGKAKVTSIVTWEAGTFCFGVLHLGDHNINAGVRRYQDEATYQTMVAETTRTCAGADFQEVIRLLDKHFGMSTYFLKDLFRDEQHKVLDNILDSALAEIEAAYQQVYQHHYPPMRFLSELGYPIPKSYKSAAELILNASLSRAFGADTLDIEQIKGLLGEVEIWQIELDSEGLSYILQKKLERMMAGLMAQAETEQVKELLTMAEMLPSLPFAVDLWKVQNLYHELLHSIAPEFQKKAEQGEEAAREWLDLFLPLGSQLQIKVG